MSKVKVKCSWCGTDIYRYPSILKVSKNSYCSSVCRSKHISKVTNPKGYTKHEHLAEYNRENNKNRMTMEVRRKLRLAKLGKGKGEGYVKLYGVHEHRVVAKQKLGRELLPGEVVHHIDGNKRNNAPDNLMVFSSQKEHAAYHALLKKAGDAE